MTEWKNVNYLRQGESKNYDYQLVLPTPLANWDVFDYWEKERVRSMAEHLRPEDLLFDVGSEMGWQSVVFAQMCKVFLIEPSIAMWPNIYQTWKKNISHNPEGCYQGLLGNTDKDFSPGSFGWPKVTDAPLVDFYRYEYLHEHTAETAQLTIDTLAYLSGKYPTALTIDVEGAELLTLIGAEKVLTIGHPKLWISVHGDLMEKNYGHTPQMLVEYLQRFGYTEKVLDIDHETHVFFT